MASVATPALRVLCALVVGHITDMHMPIPNDMILRIPPVVDQYQEYVGSAVMSDNWEGPVTTATPPAVILSVLVVSAT